MQALRHLEAEPGLSCHHPQIYSKKKSTTDLANVTNIIREYNEELHKCEILLKEKQLKVTDVENMNGPVSIFKNSVITEKLYHR